MPVTEDTDALALSTLNISSAETPIEDLSQREAREDQATSQEEQPVKRKRGRPRKIRLEEPKPKPEPKPREVKVFRPKLKKIPCKDYVGLSKAEIEAIERQKIEEFIRTKGKTILPARYAEGYVESSMWDDVAAAD